MRRLAGVLVLAAFAVAPLAADLTITTVTTIEGVMVPAGSAGMNPTVVVRLSGTKARMEVEMGDQSIVTISDSATNQMYLMRPAEKTATLVNTTPAAAPGVAAPPGPRIDASVTATGQKRDIDGVSCDEYAVSMKIDMAALAGSGSALPPEAAAMLKDVFMTVSGSIWAAKSAPGAAEYAVFQKDAARLTAAAMAASSPGGAPSPMPSGMDRLLTGFPEVTGIPYLSEMNAKVEGSGQLVAVMQQMGQMKITGKVTSISTDPVSADLFTVPEGYTVVK